MSKSLIDQLKRIDSLCCELHSCWKKAESIKLEIAEMGGISKQRMIKEGVFVVEVAGK